MSALLASSQLLSPEEEVYVLVDQSRCHVAIHRRSTDWHPEILTDPADVLTVPALEWSIPLRDLYERTPFAA